MSFIDFDVDEVYARVNEIETLYFQKVALEKLEAAAAAANWGDAGRAAVSSRLDKVRQAYEEVRDKNLRILKLLKFPDIPLRAGGPVGMYASLWSTVFTLETRLREELNEMSASQASSDDLSILERLKALVRLMERVGGDRKIRDFFLMFRGELSPEGTPPKAPRSSNEVKISDLRFF